jgi:hypothetical protein
MLAMQRLIQIAKVQIPDAIHLQQMDAPQIKTLAEPKKMVRYCSIITDDRGIFKHVH